MMTNTRWARKALAMQAAERVAAAGTTSAQQARTAAAIQAAERILAAELYRNVFGDDGSPANSAPDTVSNPPPMTQAEADALYEKCWPTRSTEAPDDLYDSVFGG